MNCKNETFDIKEFSSFRNIAEQYSDAFIKSQKAVIAENNENEKSDMFYSFFAACPVHKSSLQRYIMEKPF